MSEYISAYVSDCISAWFVPGGDRKVNGNLLFRYLLLAYSPKTIIFYKIALHVGSPMLKFMTGKCARQVPCWCTSGLVNLVVLGTFHTNIEPHMLPLRANPKLPC